VIKSAVLTDANGLKIEVEGPFLYTPAFLRKPRKTRTVKQVVVKVPSEEPPKSLKGRKSKDYVQLKMREVVGTAKYLSKDGTKFSVAIADFSETDGVKTYILLFIAPGNKFCYHPDGGFIANNEKLSEIRLFDADQLAFLAALGS
jgi:hypothetical protein